MPAADPKYDQTITINENGRTFLAVLSPWLNAGETYQCELFVDNSYNYRRVSVDQVDVLAAAGADATKNGIPDWVETLLRANNGFDTRSIHSRTSPATVEGKARYFDFLNTNGVAATKAPNGRFFAEVPLTPGAPVSLEFAFENGGLTQTARAHWEPTNLKQLDTDTLTIRQGDSLLLTAVKNLAQAATESYTLTIHGQTFGNTGDHPTPVAFPAPGTQTIQLTHTAADGTTSTRRLTVHVLPLVAIESPLCVTGFPRLWTHGPLPTGADFQFD